MRSDRAFLAAALFALAAPFAAAQDYPAREIRSLCNFGAGSGADIVVRFYSDPLSQLARKPVIVEKKARAHGAVTGLPASLGRRGRERTRLKSHHRPKSYSRFFFEKKK